MEKIKQIRTISQCYKRLKTDIKPIKYIATLVLFLLSATMARAVDFTEGGLKYEVIGATSTVKVVSNSYTGTSYTIPATVNYNSTTYTVVGIGEEAFKGCRNLTSITISEGVKSIGKMAFISTNLASVTIPVSVTSIEDWAFSGAKFTSVTIPGNITTLGDKIFSDCTSLASVIISEGLESIGIGMFNGCAALTSITIPASVTSIGKEAFSSAALTSITIPENVTSIGDRAFSGCGVLTSVTMKSTTPPTLGTGIFQNITPTPPTITVPYGSKSAYVAATGWATFSSQIKEAPAPPTPTPPTYTSYHVSLPAVEGVTFIRFDQEFKSVERDVLEGESFGFYIKLAEGLDPESVEVTTTNDDIIEPRESDGMYVIRNIQKDLTIHVKVSSTPLSNEPEVERATRVWSEASAIVINADSPAKASIVSLAGAIKAIREIPAGETRFNLPPDIYLVTVGTETVKVIVK